MRHRLLLLLALALAAVSFGCSNPEYVRGSEVAGLDDPAMSTGLDKRDLQKLMHENMKNFLQSAAVRAWAGNPQPRLAIYPLANETSEHIDSQLDALLSDVESFLVNSNQVTVISVERQRQMMAEIGKQHGGGFDPTQIAEVNKQLGAEYYITGKVFTSAERTEDARRVQYFMFMQMIEVATSAIRWQNKSELTKGLIDTE